MFAPSINVDLEKLQEKTEAQAPRRKTAAKGRAAAARKAAAKPDKKD
jgi:hypothetical protein